MQPDHSNIEWQYAWELATRTNHSFFLTGKAGTGKSTFIRELIEQKGTKKMIVLAPTGLTAINIGGSTIHSFFRFPLRPLLPNDPEIREYNKFSHTGRLMREVQTIIIDEISMVRADLLDGIDQSLRLNCRRNIPFAGKQLIMVGDIFQLEPVVDFESGTHEVLRDHYPSAYFFHARVLKEIKLINIELEKIYRQKDQEFIGVLNRIRENLFTEIDLQHLNGRHISGMDELPDFAVLLTTTNLMADRINRKQLHELNEEVITYDAVVEGMFDENRFPTIRKLELKRDAQVLLIRNDTQGRWVNGTIAKIHSLSKDQIEIRKDDGSVHRVEQCTWENSRYHYDALKKVINQEVMGTFKQYPIKLAWAITIHKSQGMTFQRCVIDFGTGTFAHGQAYVALSRCSSLEGMFLSRPVMAEDIKVDNEIVEFAQRFSESEKLVKELLEK